MTKFVCADGYTRDFPEGSLVEDIENIYTVDDLGAYGFDTVFYEPNQIAPVRWYLEQPMPAPFFDVTQFHTWTAVVYRSSLTNETEIAVVKYDPTDTVISYDPHFSFMNKELIEVIGPVKSLDD